MKLLFFISSMKSGGAERVMAVLTNELSKRGHDVTLTIMTGRSSFYTLNPNIKVRHFGYKSNKDILKKITNKIKYYSYIRKVSRLEKPDAIISFIYSMNTNVLLSTFFLGIPIIISEHNTLNQKKTFWERFQRFDISRLADCLTILTQYDYDFLGKKLKNKIVMPNPLSFPPIIEYNSHRDKVILAVGSVKRYTHKGFDNLIEIWSYIADKHPDWKLKIAGNYTQQSLNYLKKIERDKKIINRVQFLGQVTDVKKLYNTSSIFILSSRWEGLPMALMEAMSQGCTCISYDLISGPNEIITNNVDGILVENQDKMEMVEQLKLLIESQHLRERLAKKAIKSITRFSAENITDKWEKALNGLVIK